MPISSHHLAPAEGNRLRRAAQLGGGAAGGAGVLEQTARRRLRAEEAVGGRTRGCVPPCPRNAAGLMQPGGRNEEGEVTRASSCNRG